MTRRSLTKLQRARIFDAAEGICSKCGTKINAGRGEAWDVSHEIPLEAGGADDESNMRPAHRSCHREHTAKVDAPLIAKTKRQRQKHLGVRSSSKPMPCGRNSRFKKTMSGAVVDRITGEPIRNRKDAR